MALHESFSPGAEHADGTAHESGEQRKIFGSYLLFKLLKRDALGEVYRAGQLGEHAVERVVSLRLFNGREIEGERFWQACQPRLPLRSALRGGPFGEVVDAGLEAGIPYFAHEYVFGRSLAELMAQARERSNPVPLEQSLLLMNRIANALRNAHDARLEGERVLHGFLVPGFIHLSSEGEVRLTGFESSEALLELSATGTARGALAGYLSPEVNQGLAPKPSDDVYSLGAIFCELLSGEPLPALNPSEASRWIDATALAAEGSPLPEDVRHLLRESLLPRDNRIRTAEQWHKQLVDITAASGLSPTTFNLAFFMHTLFGDELDREVELVEIEKRVGRPAEESIEAIPPTAGKVTANPALRPVASVAVPAAAALSTPRKLEAAPAPRQEPIATSESRHRPLIARDSEPPSAPPSSDVLEPIPVKPERAPTPAPVRRPMTQSRAQAAPSSGLSKRWIGIGAAVLAIGGLVAFFALNRSERGVAPSVPANATVDTTALAAQPAPATATGLDAAPSALGPEEIEAQVRSLVAERAEDMEAGLKAEYDQRLVKLRGQLEQARKAEAGAAAATRQASDTTADVGTGPATGRTSAQRATIGGPAAALAEQEPAEPSAEALLQAEPAPEPREIVAVTRSRARQIAPPEEIQTRLEPASTVPALEIEPELGPEPARRVEPVAPGSIVTSGPGVTAPRLVRQPTVVYPPAAARLKRQATVKVRILIDETGKPTEIEQIGEEIGLGFDSAAMQAARTTQWTPPEKDGVAVRMWVDLSIAFRP